MGRNWTESGFKTYSGPIANPWPITAERGMVVRQAVTVTYRGSPRTTNRVSVPAITVGSASGLRPPQIGYSVPDVGPPPTPAEASLLRMAKPSFIHADVRQDDDTIADLERISSTLAAMDRPLLASLYVGVDPQRDIDRFVRWCDSTSVSLEGVLVFGREAASPLGVGTSQATIQTAMPRLRMALPGVPIGVGSDRFLSEVIRSEPTTYGADAIAFGMSPSGHADEDWAIIENLPAQGDAVRTLRAYLGPTPIIAGPVTLQTRFGGWPRAPHRIGDLPPQVDVRQRLSLAAAWTLGSVRELTLAGAAFAIYYETLGWRGLLERESGSAMPSRFKSRPLEVFPLFHVLADLGELRGVPLVDTELEGPVSALAFGVDHLSSILMANLSPAIVSVRVGPLSGRQARVRILDRRSLGTARRGARRFRQSFRQVEALGGVARVELGPYAYARVDVPAAYDDGVNVRGNKEARA